MNRSLALILLLFSFDLLQGQEPRFRHHEIGDANAGIPINVMLQDYQCMLWLGTDNGLARYDGHSWFAIAVDSNKQQLQVTSLMEDGKGQIWIGTASGAIYYLDLARKLHFFEVEEGHPAKAITSIYQDQHEQIWFATYGEGVYLYTGARMYNFGMDDGLSGNDIYAMTPSSSGEVWLATDDGINICSFRDEKKQIKSLGLKEGLPDQIITALETDENGNVWIGTFENGVALFNAATQKIEIPFSKSGMDEITSFDIFDGNELWIGTRKSGLWHYNQNTGFARKLINLFNVYPGEISDILTDVEGNIWICLEEGMLLSSFRPFEILETNIGEIQALFSDQRDQLWVGTKNGIYQVEVKETSISSMKRIAPSYNFNVTDILEDSFHNIWIGTLDKGLYVYNPVTGQVYHNNLYELEGTTIMSMASSDSTIWMATLQGVVSYPRHKNIIKEKTAHFDILNDPWQSTLHFVFQVFVDSKDRTWFATDGDGIYCLQGDSVRHYAGRDSLVISKVLSVCEDDRGHMWFNTTDHGLIEFDGRNYKPLGIAEGLGNLNTASITKAGTGDIVIAHNRGIDIMEPDRRHFMYYTEEIGLNEIDPGLNSGITNSRGDVYISGTNMIIKYYATENQLSIHPRTQLTGVSVYGKPVDFLEQHRFGYNQNYISFDYVGIWYTSPKSVNYLYKLENYDIHWKESRDKVASYSSLPPGEYTFYVKASENRSFLDEPLASYSFVIEKPFWLRHWFIGSVVVVLAALFYWIVKSRERRSERQALLKKEMIESQLQALKAQINPHFLFNSFNTLITIIDENARQPEVAIEYVEKLSDFFRSILQYRQQESITLEEEWELVQNYGYLLDKRYGSNLRIHMSDPPKDGCILPLTLQMLVENAVKHNVIAENKPLDVYINVDDDGYVSVRNNMQPKSKKEPSTHFGLQSIMKRYNMLSDRKMIVESTDKSFVVRIPILKKSS